MHSSIVASVLAFTAVVAGKSLTVDCTNAVNGAAVVGGTDFGPGLQMELYASTADGACSAKTCMTTAVNVEDSTSGEDLFIFTNQRTDNHAHERQTVAKGHARGAISCAKSAAHGLTGGAAAGVQATFTGYVDDFANVKICQVELSSATADLAAVGVKC